MVYLVYLVCLVGLVISFIEPEKPKEPNKQDRRFCALREHRRSSGSIASPVHPAPPIDLSRKTVIL